MKRHLDQEYPPNKQIKRKDPVELPDDIVYEIVNWIPHKMIVSTISFVNKRWNTIIKKRIGLELSLDTDEWFYFKRFHSDLFPIVTSLKLNDKYFSMSLTREDLEKMVNLKHLVLLNLRSCMDNNTLEPCANNLKSIEFITCSVSWKTIAYLSDKIQDISYSEVYHEPNMLIDPSSTGQFIFPMRDVLSCPSSLRNIENIKKMSLMDSGLRMEMSVRDIDIYHESIKKNKDLTTLIIIDDNPFLKHLHRMKNLTALHLACNNRELSNVPDLSPLTKLRELSIELTKDSIQKITPILSNLQTLTLRSVNTKDIKTILNLGNLNNLTIHSSCIRNGESFSMKNLSRLILSNVELMESTLDSIRRMESLKELSLLKCHKIISVNKRRIIPKDALINIRDLCQVMGNGLIFPLKQLESLSIPSLYNDPMPFGELVQLKKLKSISISFYCRVDEMDHFDQSIPPEYETIATDPLTKRILAIDHSIIRSVSKIESLRHLKIESDFITGTSFWISIPDMSSLKRIVNLEIYDLYPKPLDFLGFSSMEKLEILSIRKSKHFDCLDQLSGSNIRHLCFDDNLICQRDAKVLLSMKKLMSLCLFNRSSRNRHKIDRAYWSVHMSHSNIRLYMK